MKMNEISIGKHKVGADEPCLIIAEAGVNHNGDKDIALQMVDTASDAGADVVKFQTFKAENVATPQTPKATYSMVSTDVKESHLDMMRKLELSASVHRDLMEHCQKRDIMFLSSPFDLDSVDLLDDLGVEAFKVPSGEITNIPLLAHIAGKGKPMIVSSGMANIGEVDAAIETILQTGNTQLVLLHCVSNYPARPADVNLRAMGTMTRAFGFPVGFSDHTLGIDVSIAAVAMGARVLEKHFTLNQNMDGPDHAASLEPEEFGNLVKSVRTIEAALGDGKKRPVENELDTAMVARKSIVARHDMPDGTVLSGESIDVKRPGTGLSPAMIPFILGRSLKMPVTRDMMITLDMLR